MHRLDLGLYSHPKDLGGGGGGGGGSGVRTHVKSKGKSPPPAERQRHNGELHGDERKNVDSGRQTEDWQTDRRLKQRLPQRQRDGGRAWWR